MFVKLLEAIWIISLIVCWINLIIFYNSKKWRRWIVREVWKENLEFLYEAASRVDCEEKDAFIKREVRKEKMKYLVFLLIGSVIPLINIVLAVLATIVNYAFYKGEVDIR